MKTNDWWPFRTIVIGAFCVVIGSYYLYDKHQVDQTIAAAEKFDRPWKSYQYLHNKVWFEKENVTAGAIDAYRPKLESYFSAAVTAMDPDAIYQIFVQREQGWDKQKIASKVLASVESSTGVSGKMLYTAGFILNEGEFAVRSTERSIDYFSRAWVAGVEIAAAKNAEAYKAMNDPENAYLWAVRCINSCRANSAVRPEDYEKGLASTDRYRIERVALDTSVLKLPK